jgi:hypothetical protein
VKQQSSYVGNAPLNRKKWVDFVYKAPNDTKLIGKLYLFFLEAPCEEIIQIGCVLGKFHDEM